MNAAATTIAIFQEMKKESISNAGSA